MAPNNLFINNTPKMIGFKGLPAGEKGLSASRWASRADTINAPSHKTTMPNQRTDKQGASNKGKNEFESETSGTNIELMVLPCPGADTKTPSGESPPKGMSAIQATTSTASPMSPPRGYPPHIWAKQHSSTTTASQA